MTSEAFLGGSTEAIPEISEQIEKDISLPRTITMPLLLFKLCKKYNVSVSEATQEGALMLLRQNESFMESEGSIEEIYRNAQSRYKDKIQTLTKLLNKMHGAV